jgi:sec-independent protein translocase protein TatA
MQQIKKQDRANIDREKLESLADTLGIDYSTKNDEELRISIETEINRSRNKTDNIK